MLAKIQKDIVNKEEVIRKYEKKKEFFGSLVEKM